MKGQIAARNMDEEIRDTFADFGSDIIDIDLLRLMVQVAILPWLLLLLLLLLLPGLKLEGFQSKSPVILLGGIIFWIHVGGGGFIPSSPCSLPFLTQSPVQDLELKLTDSELEGMISDASVTGSKWVTEEEYVTILKHSSWI